jgi:hypothetical protein
MTRPSTPAVAALVLALVVAPVAVAALPAGGNGAAAGSAEADVQPGEQFAGAVAVQGAELDGEVEQRTFETKLERANGSRAKAGVVAGEAAALDERLAELRERKQRLDAARENGSISEGRYRAEVAGLAARIAALERRSNRTATVARGLPAEALEAKGVNVSAIERLRGNAANLTGPEVAEIARSIGGRDAGKSMPGRGPGAANRTGGPPGEDPPGRSGNGSNGPPDEGPGNGSSGSPGESPGNGSAPGAGDGDRGGNAGGEGNRTAGNATSSLGRAVALDGSPVTAVGSVDAVSGTADRFVRPR